jgi:elongation factor Ts
MEPTAKQVMDLRAATGLPMMKCKEALRAAGGDFEKAIEILRKEGLKTAAAKGDRAMPEGIVKAKTKPQGAKVTMVFVRCETEPVRNTPDFRGFVDRVLEVADATNPKDVPALLAAKWTGKEGTTVQEAQAFLVAKIGENIQVGGVAAWTAAAGEYVGHYVHHDERKGSVLRLGATAVTPVFEALVREACQHVVFSRPVAMSRTEIPEATVEKEREIFRGQVAQDPKMAGKPPQVVENVVKGRLEAFYKDKVLPDQGWYKDDKQSVATVLKAQGATVKGYALFIVGA